jgi:hypothetical protein
MLRSQVRFLLAPLEVLPARSPDVGWLGRLDPGCISTSAGDLLVELRAAHVRLRELFADGLDDAVCALARDVMELASETTDVLNQDQEPSGR